MCLINTMKTELENLVRACQRKETWAQKAIYDMFAPSMLGVCMRYVRSRDEAHDLLHDGFIKVFESIGRLEKSQSLSSWIYNIMVHASINYVTRQCDIEYSDLDNYAETYVEDNAIDTDNYPIAEVMQAIQSLKERYRVVFNMHAVEGLGYAEIAQQLHIPETTIRSQYARACHILRQKLETQQNGTI